MTRTTALNVACDRIRLRTSRLASGLLTPLERATAEVEQTADLALVRSLAREMTWAAGEATS
jgi:hypothetical protein